MSWILTYTGKKFHPAAVREDMINILDIAHALSNICRFAGHTPSFYSVAQHSVIVSKIIEESGHSKERQLLGLMHDATEAYLIDLPQPIKRLEIMAPYCAMEERLAKVIASRFGLSTHSDDWVHVKDADMVALATEARDLMGDPDDWESLHGVHPWEKNVFPLEPEKAKLEFLQRYFQLTEGK